MNADVSGRRRQAVALTSLRAGLWAGAAMMPFGMAFRRLGYPVNVYGELVVRAVLGSAPLAAQLVVHAVVSVTLGAPFVTFARWRGLARVIAGATYGVVSWAVLNATLLPLWFGRPTGWVLGFGAVWPSLVVHVVFGTALAAVTPRGAPSEAVEPREQGRSIPSRRTRIAGSRRR